MIHRIFRGISSKPRRRRLGATGGVVDSVGGFKVARGSGETVFYLWVYNFAGLLTSPHVAHNPGRTGGSGGGEQHGPLLIEVALVRIDAPNDLPDLRCISQAHRVVAEGIEGPVHRVQHPEGVPSVQRINRLFQSTSHRIPNPPDSGRSTYP